MTTTRSSPIEMMALGRPFQLGMLYDSRSDQLIPGITLWDAQLLKDNIDRRLFPQTLYDISKEDTLQEKSRMLTLDGNLKISILAGLVDVSGSAKYIHDFKSTARQERLTLKYSTTTHFEQLTMSHLGKGNAKYTELFDQQIATHVVTGITYGAEAFFIFNRTLSSNEDRTEVHGHVEAMLKKIPTFDISGKFELNLNDKEKKTAETLTCQFYGDFRLESNPGTFEEAVKLYQQLPSLLGANGEKAVAKKVSLYPLYLLDNSALQITREISSNLINVFTTLMEDLHALQIKVKDLINDVAYNPIFHRIKKQLPEFSARISEFKINVMKRLKDILPKIRGDSLEEMALVNLFQEINSSPFNRQKLEDWFNLKTQEINSLDVFACSLRKEDNIDTSSSSVHKALSDPDCEFTVCLVVHLIEENEWFLNEMYQYLNDNTYKYNNQNIASTHWIHQSIRESARKNMRLFLEFAKANKNNQNIKFVVDEQYSGKCNMGKGMSVIFYRDGTTCTDFQISSKPGKPTASNVTHNSITLVWLKPEYGSQSVQQYKIYSETDGNNQWKELLITEDSTESKAILNLSPETTYKFKIQAITLAGESAESEVSKTIQTKSNPSASAASKMLLLSELIQLGIDGCPNIYKIGYDEQIIDEKMRLRKCSIGERVPIDGIYPKEKIVLLIGASGSGKTTLINVLVNYYYGTTWKDNFRFQLVTEEDKSDSGIAINQSKSQTKYISAYTFHCQSGCSVPYTLTVIDTPGFGVIDGIERDNEIIEQIREFFTITGRNSIDHIDAVGFVTSSSVTCLSPTQMYIFNSVLSVFGKDIKSNIFLLTTFTDGTIPPVLEAIKYANVPHRAVFKFNNSALMAKNELTRKELEINFDKMFWKMGVISLSNFLNEIQKIESVSLSLTNEVLKERHHLETVLQRINLQINTRFHIFHELRQEEQKLQNHSNEVEPNKNFEYTVSVIKQRIIDLDVGKYATNCVQCNVTCRFPCDIALDGGKHGCDAVQPSKNIQDISKECDPDKILERIISQEDELAVEDIYCTVCPGKCSWTKHFNNSYRFENYIEEETRTSEEKPIPYNIAKNELLKKQANCDHRAVERNVYGLISRARDTLERLHEIALKSNPFFIVNSIELLIESEKQEGKSGWQQRIKHLTNAKTKAELMEKIQDPSYEPFESCLSLPSKSKSNSLSSINPYREVQLYESDDLDNN